MKLYMIRHGETDWNRSGKVQGLTDIELNAKGIEQANQMKNMLKDVEFDICFCSPLKRARKTAEIIANDKCNVNVDDLLIERSFGKYEGKNLKEENIDIVKLWSFNDDYNYCGVEPMEDLLNRADMFIKKIKSEYKECSNVLIVSHGGFIKGLYYSVNGYNENTDFLSFHLNNCEVYECEILEKRNSIKK